MVQYNWEIKQSVGPSVFIGNKNAYSSIINSRIIIRISGKMAYQPRQENEVIFSKNNVSKVLDRIFEKLRSCLLLLHIGGVTIFCISSERD